MDLFFWFLQPAWSSARNREKKKFSLNRLITFGNREEAYDNFYVLLGFEQTDIEVFLVYIAQRFSSKLV